MFAIIQVNSTHTQCPCCGNWNPNSNKFCLNSVCSLAEHNWNGYMIVLQNPVTGQTANLSEMGKFPKAVSMGFTRLGPIPANAPKPTPTHAVATVVGFVPTIRVVPSVRVVSSPSLVIYRY